MSNSDEVVYEASPGRYVTQTAASTSDGYITGWQDEESFDFLGDAQEAAKRNAKLFVRDYRVVKR